MSTPFRASKEPRWQPQHEREARPSPPRLGKTNCEKLTDVCCTHTHFDRTVPQGEGEFEYFEQVQLINLCPMEAEEAKALIPRSVSPLFPPMPVTNPRS